MVVLQFRCIVLTVFTGQPNLNYSRKDVKPCFYFKLVRQPETRIRLRIRRSEPNDDELCQKPKLKAACWNWPYL